MQRIENVRLKIGRVVVQEELVLDNDGVVWEHVEATSDIRGYDSGLAWAYFWGDL